MNIKYILLLTLICFCYPLKHCLQCIKVCNMNTTSISHCSLGWVINVLNVKKIILRLIFEINM